MIDIPHPEKTLVQSIQSKSKTNTKMTSSKFKEDMTDISGITYKRPKESYFCGLKEMTIEDLNEDEE